MRYLLPLVVFTNYGVGCAQARHLVPRAARNPGEPARPLPAICGHKRESDRGTASTSPDSVFVYLTQNTVGAFVVSWLEASRPLLDAKQGGHTACIRFRGVHLPTRRRGNLCGMALSAVHCEHHLAHSHHSVFLVPQTPCAQRGSADSYRPLNFSGRFHARKPLGTALAFPGKKMPTRGGKWNSRFCDGAAARSLEYTETR